MRVLYSCVASKRRSRVSAMFEVAASMPASIEKPGCSTMSSMFRWRQRSTSSRSAAALFARTAASGEAIFMRYEACETTAFTSERCHAR